MLERLSKNAKITLSILFCFGGLFLLTFTYFGSIKSNLFNQKNIELLEQKIVISEEIKEINVEETTTTVATTTKVDNSKDKRDNYIGYLELPDLKLKRGFVSPDSKYNSIGYNVTIIDGSTMPDVDKGNFILAAHRGNSSVSFFNNLYKLKIGAKAYVTYNGKKYTYKLVETYYVDKNGTITIKRDGSKTCLTLITCVKEKKTKQQVFNFELVSVE